MTTSSSPPAPSYLTEKAGNSGPLSRLRERVRVRARPKITFALTAALLSFAACGSTSPGGASDAQPIQSPDDSTGGYFIATVAPGMGTPRATLYDSTGNTELASFVADSAGAGLSF